MEKSQHILPTDVADGTDGRRKLEYKTRYPECKNKIIRDAIYLMILLFIGLVGMCLNFLGILAEFFNLSGYKSIIFTKVNYCIISGFLGGATFGIKYFYRVVARGWWNEDRVFWRLFSPIISIPISLVMASIMIDDVTSSSSLAISIGFLTGYFSDEAVGKMYDVACALFSVSNRNSEISKIKKEVDECESEEE